MSKPIPALIALVACSTTQGQGPTVAPAHLQSLRTPVVLTAHAELDAYSNIAATLFAQPETPDCAHPEFGPHITQTIDSELGRPVFLFHAHVHPDNDRCLTSDRQRTEIKTMNGSNTPEHLMWFNGERLRARWLFKLASAFKPSPHFTHLHQLKDSGLEGSLPVVTLTARKKISGDRLELSHISNSGGSPIVLATADLNLLRGHWIEAHEDVTFGAHGKYSILLRRFIDQQQILSFSSDDIDTWRTDAPIMRPKWGIYRSLQSPSELNDETVSFGGFCLAKGNDDCVQAW